MEKITTWVKANKVTAIIIAVVIFAVFFATGSPDFMSFGNEAK
jgi:predicted PurR-regulated permease PerM